MIRTFMLYCVLIVTGTQAAMGWQEVGTVKEALLSNLESISNRVSTMADDFPEAKMNYKASPEVRSFSEILLHIGGTNYYYIKAATSKNLGSEDPKTTEYDTRAKTSEFLSKSFQALREQISLQQETELSNNLAIWIESVMHINEHYGNLVVYYRLNKLIPPSSRP